MIFDVVTVFIPSTIAFLVGLALTPSLTTFLYRHQCWKKSAKVRALDGHTTPLFNALHYERETKTPRMGGVVIWGSVILTLLVFRFLPVLVSTDIVVKLNFLSRGQTWLPVFTLFVGSVIGLIDDVLEVRGGGSYVAGGLSLSKRLFIVALTAGVGAWWFFAKLGITNILVPFLGVWELGLLFIPFFILTMLFVYAGGVIDGIDGLAGGVFASIFTAYGGIAFFQGQFNLAAFCAVVVGALLAFLWFNIPPARFYMSETGTMGLTMTLTVVAFLTGAVGVLPIIAFPLFATVFSDIVQLLSKKMRGGKKVFRIAPLHHHFEALGWPGEKVTMRYWVLSIVCAMMGMIVALVA